MDYVEQHGPYCRNQQSLMAYEPFSRLISESFWLEDHQDHRVHPIWPKCLKKRETTEFTGSYSQGNIYPAFNLHFTFPNSTSALQILCQCLSIFNHAGILDQLCFSWPRRIFFPHSPSLLVILLLDKPALAIVVLTKNSCKRA